MNISESAKLVADIGVLLGVAIPVTVALRCIIGGVRCLLRSQMLSIYYHNLDNKAIRQYECENFMLMYKAYKALRGNSFIDEIYDFVKEWKIVS